MGLPLFGLPGFGLPGFDLLGFGWSPLGNAVARGGFITSTLTVPRPFAMASPGAPTLEPSFPQALEIATQWLALWEAGELSDEVLADRVSELVVSREGARGFFVVALAGDSPLMDRLPDPVALVLRAGGHGVVDLTVRNLAMSSAMVIHHVRSGDGAMQGGSERVQARSTELLRLLDPGLVKQRLETLLAATGGNGEDVTFLDRWGYDAEQRAAIAAAALAVAEG